MSNGKAKAQGKGPPDGVPGRTKIRERGGQGRVVELDGGVGVDPVDGTLTDRTLRSMRELGPGTYDVEADGVDATAVVHDGWVELEERVEDAGPPPGPPRVAGRGLRGA